MILQGKAVLIKPDKLPERTKTGRLIIPATAKDLPQTGRVVLCGPECEEVSIGNRVHFGRKAASVISIEGEEHYFVNEDKILYIE